MPKWPTEALSSFKIGQVVEGVAAVGRVTGVILGFMSPMVPMENDLETNQQLEMMRDFAAEHLGLGEVVDVAFLRSIVKTKGAAVRSTSHPMGVLDVCVVLAYDHRHSSSRDLPLHIPTCVVVVDAASLTPAQLPAAESLDDPVAAEKVRALERECGRYFTRRSHDGRGFLPTAATAAHFGGDPCFSE